jgi:hypothetical protein
MPNANIQKRRQTGRRLKVLPGAVLGYLPLSPSAADRDTLNLRVRLVRSGGSDPENIAEKIMRSEAT